MPKNLRESKEEETDWCAKCTNYRCKVSLYGGATGKCRIDDTIVKGSQVCDEYELDGLFIYVRQTIDNLERIGKKK